MKRALFIDDDEDDVLLTLAELRRGGYRPEWVRVDTADTLVAALQDGSWDLITCDWVMPGFSGPAALELLRRHKVDAPIIVISGQVGEEYAVTAMKAGAHDFVGKHDLVRLLPAVERELREVAERRAHRLVEARVRFQADLLDAVGQAVIAGDVDGRITYWNRAAEALYGWSAAEALGQSIFDLVPGEEKLAAEHVLAALSASDSWTGEILGRHRDGRRIAISATLSAVRDGAGVLTGVIGVSSDISERKTAAEAIAAIAARQAEILDALPAHVAVLDVDGTISAVNRAWREFARANELTDVDCGVGTNYFAVCMRATGADADDARAVESGVRAVIDGRATSFEHEYACHSPWEERWFRVMVAPLRTGGAGAVVLHINVTERVVAERARMAR